MKKPKTAKELSKIFSRSQARVSEILIELKKQNKVEDFRVGSKNHWVRIPHNFVIISKVKEKYLNILKVPCQTYQIAKTLGVTHNTSRNRLSELEKLRLVEKKEKLWHKKKNLKNNRRIIVGTDEAGSEV